MEAAASLVTTLSDPLSFDWRDAPLSDVRTPTVGVCVYVGLVLSLDALCVQRRSDGGKGAAAGLSSHIGPIQAVHNALLSVISLIMLVGTVCEAGRRVAADGSALWLVCEVEGTTARGPLYFWVYVYYVSKYWELLDTILQLLKGRRPPSYLLHVYHHAGIVLAVWLWIDTVGTLIFVGQVFNCLVHVVMYLYFALKSVGIDPWWKRYITQLQIVQFATSFACAAVTVTLHTTGHRCSGMMGTVVQLAFNATLLYGFVGVLSRVRREKMVAKGSGSSSSKTE
ncbi:unnamed protein product [Vitrella brassicaformis CCMP3155]|uniref:Elongation of fatty acids protein n=2 Tax=Vitrella brassicaformis TaxID=1169539 RepID=A0A0G4EB33_VITBC|nr:unnamed protein product [Vitrella brassicaformis CCMP3155]|eukprot:CEL92701.1 unnamed protein product [Vitrella brassicaformis CCMP3155]